MEIEISEHVNKDRQAWNRTCLAAGIPALRFDTCARIMAVLYVHGNNEAFTFNGKFLADMEYIQNRFHLHGAGTPDSDFTETLQGYIRELEEYDKDNANKSSEAVFSSAKPQWAVDLFKEMYNIKI